MKGNPNISDYGFQPGQSGNPNGRPKKSLNSFVQQAKAEGFTGASASHVVEAYEFLINLTETRIKEIISDPDSPMMLRIVGKAMLGNKGADMIEKIMERAYGKAKQQVDLSGLSIMPSVSTDQFEKLLKAARDNAASSSQSE